MLRKTVVQPLHFTEEPWKSAMGSDTQSAVIKPGILPPGKWILSKNLRIASIVLCTKSVLCDLPRSFYPKIISFLKMTVLQFVFN